MLSFKTYIGHCKEIHSYEQAMKKMELVREIRTTSFHRTPKQCLDSLNANISTYENRFMKIKCTFCHVSSFEKKGLKKINPSATNNFQMHLCYVLLVRNTIVGIVSLKL